jgi:hypothetical protein
MSAHESVIEQLPQACIHLLQNAEFLRPAAVERVAIVALQTGLVVTDPSCASLAFAIERICDEMIAGRVAPGICLPSLCAAADALAQHSTGVDAARYELDTLLPLPTSPAAASQLVTISLSRSNSTLTVEQQIAQRRAARVANQNANDIPLRQHYDVAFVGR